MELPGGIQRWTPTDFKQSLKWFCTYDIRQFLLLLFFLIFFFFNRLFEIICMCVSQFHWEIFVLSMGNYMPVQIECS